MQKAADMEASFLQVCANFVVYACKQEQHSAAWTISVTRVSDMGAIDMIEVNPDELVSFMI